MSSAKSDVILDIMWYDSMKKRLQQSFIKGVPKRLQHEHSPTKIIVHDDELNQRGRKISGFHDLDFSVCKRLAKSKSIAAIWHAFSKE